jgi:putative transposase
MKPDPISYTTRQTKGNNAIVGNKLQVSKLGLIKFAKSKEVDGIPTPAAEMTKKRE